MELNIKKFVLPPKAKGILGILLGVGVLTFLTGLSLDPQRAWANFLLEYYFWLCVALAGIFFVALQHITGSTWSVPLRRIPEAFVAYLPVALLLFCVLLIGAPRLYEWMHHDIHDPLLTLKSGYLNKPFFIVRQLLLLGVSFVVGFCFVKNSLRQDRTGDLKLTKRNVAISAPFLLFFAWAFSFVSIDLMMSLAPHWFSTIFGIYCWTVLFVSGVAMITMMVLGLRRAGYLGGVITEDHLHDLGKLLFAFLVFWGYIGFSQFMLIWYANLPEETVYFLSRLKEGWKVVSIALIFVKFVIPFFLLISRSAKRNPKLLLIGAVWLFAAQWLDVYWLVFPTFFARPIFGWMEIGMFLGFASIFLLCVGTFLSRVPLVPVKDPFLHEGLHHHQ